MDIISELKVMHSNAGWYLGRSYTEEGDDIVMPYSRESGYYSSEELAVSILDVVVERTKGSVYWDGRDNN
jgi:hypothetical protein